MIRNTSGRKIGLKGSIMKNNCRKFPINRTVPILFNLARPHNRTASILFLFIILAVVFASTEMAIPNAFAEDGDYIKFLPENKEIDWSKNVCDKDSITDPITKKIVVTSCKVEGNTKDQPLPAVYIMDAKKNLIYIRDFFPTRVLNLGNSSGLVLYSDSEVLYILLVFDKDDRFIGKYVIDGEPLVNKEKTGLAYRGLLIWWTAEILQLDTCTLDLLKSIGKTPKDFSSFYKSTPIQIKVITLPQNITGLESTPNKDDAIAETRDGTISNVLTLIKNKDEDILGSATFGERLFVFLAANSSNKTLLNTLVHKYRNYLGKKILTRYASTQSCKQNTIR